LRQEKQEIDQQLRAIQGTNMGSMQSFPSRRSDRAYSTDYDSRSNRGVGRGGRGSQRSGTGRNSMSGSGGNPRYSNRRNDHHRGGDDTEEEYHTRGGNFTNSGKYQGGRGAGRGGNFNKPQGGGRRGGLSAATGGHNSKDDQQNRDASSIDRGENERIFKVFILNSK
jgi:fragile X mental retardation protein